MKYLPIGEKEFRQLTGCEHDWQENIAWDLSQWCRWCGSMKIMAEPGAEEYFASMALNEWSTCSPCKNEIHTHCINYERCYCAKKGHPSGD